MKRELITYKLIGEFMAIARLYSPTDVKHAIVVSFVAYCEPVHFGVRLLACHHLRLSRFPKSNSRAPNSDLQMSDY